MKKVLITYKKQMLLAYVMPKHDDQFNEIVDKAVKECKVANDKNGLMLHVNNSLNRHGYKTLDLNNIEVKKL